jgi:hypothetical protein
MDNSIDSPINQSYDTNQAYANNNAHATSSGENIQPGYISPANTGLTGVDSVKNQHASSMPLESSSVPPSLTPPDDQNRSGQQSAAIGLDGLQRSGVIQDGKANPTDMAFIGRLMLETAQENRNANAEQRTASFQQRISSMKEEQHLMERGATIALVGTLASSGLQAGGAAKAIGTMKGGNYDQASIQKGMDEQAYFDATGKTTSGLGDYAHTSTETDQKSEQTNQAADEMTQQTAEDMKQKAEDTYQQTASVMKEMAESETDTERQITRSI